MKSKECDKPIDGATWRTTWALIVLVLPASLCAAEAQQIVRLWPTAVVVRDLDYAEAVTSFQQAKTSLQATLLTGSQGLNLSLMNFLG
jgi:hypothetical protein